jgi:hypothetical protein
MTYLIYMAGYNLNDPNNVMDTVESTYTVERKRLSFSDTLLHVPQGIFIVASLDNVIWAFSLGLMLSM